MVYILYLYVLYFIGGLEAFEKDELPFDLDDGNWRKINLEDGEVIVSIPEFVLS